MSIDGQEVAKHCTRQSCWVVVNGSVYDVTQYMDRHPGGAAILVQFGGKDATTIYEANHAEGTIEKGLPADKHLGALEPGTLPPIAKAGNDETRDEDMEIKVALSTCLSLDDIETAARSRISRSAWSYMNSAADSLGSLHNNRDGWKKITLRPRVLRNVLRVNMERTLLGQKSRLPIFIAPAARAAQSHRDGELCLARAAARAGIPFCVSTNSSIPHKDIAECMALEQGSSPYGALFFQLYVAHDRSLTIERIKMARELGFKALAITVDTPVLGKREEDERHRAELAAASGVADLVEWNPMKNTDTEDGPPLRGFHSSTLNWDDIAWIREAWQDAGPIVLKGIQTAEDAEMAAGYGVDAIYLSNHGGRQCDDAPSAIQTLLEIHKFCPHILRTKLQILLDGGVRRGADVVKALCLGATGVGLGRPFLYSVAMGTAGALRVLQLLSEELETTMRTMGVVSLDQLTPSYVNTSRLELELPQHITTRPVAITAKL